MRSATASQVGIVIRERSVSTSAFLHPPSVSAANAGSRSPADSSTSMRSLPSRDFNSAEVPDAITLPRSMTTMWSASWSASSRYCVVRSTVVPSATRSRMNAHVSRRGVQSRGWFGEDEDRWAADKAGAQVEAASHASRVGLDWPVGRLEQAEPVERFLGSRLGHLSAQSVEPADHHQVLSSGEGFVDRGVLAGQADEASNRCRVVP